MPVTKYIYNPLTEAYLMETDGDGNVTARYTQEPVKYGDIHAQHRIDPTTGVGKTYYYHPDALGSTRELTDESGTVVATYNYDAFGNTIASTGTVENPFRFTGNVGYYWDEELNTYHIRARNYQPTTGRWTSQDPIGFAGGDNLYGAYFIPFDTDPSGYEEEKQAIKPGHSLPGQSRKPGAGHSDPRPTPVIVEICSTPVLGGVAGHLFFRIEGKGYRAGPSVIGVEPVTGTRIDKGNSECKCYGKGYGQLIAGSGPWDKDNVDHPDYIYHPYPEKELKCTKFLSTVRLDELLKCFKSVEDRLYKCCIPYAGTPKLGPLDGNSNSYVAWILKICMGANNPTEWVPQDARLNPGLLQTPPKCLKEAQ